MGKNRGVVTNDIESHSFEDALKVFPLPDNKDEEGELSFPQNLYRF